MIYEKVIGSTDLVYIEINNEHEIKFQFNDEPIGTTEEIEDIFKLLNKMLKDLRNER